MTHLRIALSLALLAAPVSLAQAQEHRAPAAKEPPHPVVLPTRQQVVLTVPPRARCVDGTFWTATERQGACSAHGGVKEWFPVAEHDWAAGITARCNDGTMWSSNERQGACAGHNGVKKWRVDDDDDNARPRTATARCNDGNWWTSAQRQGACASHGGVKHWLGRSNGRGNANGHRS